MQFFEMGGRAVNMRLNTNTINIFGIPPYYFFSVVGFVFSSVLLMILLFKSKLNVSRYTKMFFISTIGVLIGARFFGIISGVMGASLHGEQITLDTIANTGIVFYGGLLGFIAMFMLVVKIWDKRINGDLIDIVAACIPLFHTFGRLGCFFAGCCYGAESTSIITVSYTSYINGETIPVYRIPVQLFESIGNLLIFILLVSLLQTGKMQNRLLLIYLTSYSVFRFIIEFFRGDYVRGIWNGISFSQIVSIAILVWCLIAFIKIIRRPFYEA